MCYANIKMSISDLGTLRFALLAAIRDAKRSVEFYREHPEIDVHPDVIDRYHKEAADYTRIYETLDHIYWDTDQWHSEREETTQS